MPNETKRPSKTPVEINVGHIDMDRMKERTTDLPGLLEYAHSIGGFSVVPSSEGQMKTTALAAMEDQTQIQMDQIFEQMKLLAEQANKIKERADISYQIYNAKMSFKPVIGKEYFLYRRESKKILSMLSPDDWGDKTPFDEFIARVKLLGDHTWKVLD